MLLFSFLFLFVFPFIFSGTYDLFYRRGLTLCSLIGNMFAAFFYCEIDGTSLCLQCDMIVHVGGKRTHGRYLLSRQRVEVCCLLPERTTNWVTSLLLYKFTVSGFLCSFQEINLGILRSRPHNQQNQVRTGEDKISHLSQQ